MTGRLCALVLFLTGCSFVNDFDKFQFEKQAEIEDADAPRKPPRQDAGGEPSTLDAETARDSAQAPLDGPLEGVDAQEVEPAAEAGHGAPEGGTRDTSVSLEGLEGAWDVELPLVRQSCAGNAPLDVDTWELALLGAGRGRLTSSWWELDGPLELEGGRAVGGRFEGLLDGVPGGPRTRWVVELALEGELLAGRTTQSTVWQDGGVSCVVERDVEGVR